VQHFAPRQADAVEEKEEDNRRGRHALRDGDHASAHRQQAGEQDRREQYGNEAVGKDPGEHREERWRRGQDLASTTTDHF
jgi:hypothetical protein